MSKFDIGSKVRVVDDSISGHGFEIGELVTIIYISDSGDIKYVCKGFDDRLWWLSEGEFERVEIPEFDTFDAVSKPSHYNHSGGIECIDYIRQVLGKEGFIAYCRGNQIKYQHRAMYKGKPIEDLEKAHQYNAWAIEALKDGM
jgi:hypothetical protein